MWEYAECYNEERPAETEFNHGSVFVRRNFEQVEATETAPAKWVYEQMEISTDAYAIYSALMAK